MAVLKEQQYTAEGFYELNTEHPRELINGYIYDMSPSPNIAHQRLSGEVFYSIREHIRKNNGRCEVFSAPTDVKLDSNTIVIPDIFVVCDPGKLDEQKCNGAPDWVIEIVSPSNASRDYADKLKIYRSAGVREYWIIDPMNEKIVAYRFETTSVVEVYTFDDDIPVGIYSESSAPLSICINKLIK
ncbi:MAG: Uma2 family endonuclease [Oscillospiraceae bacterium]|nr:Uma2 family endonuclease [Oscillospiraceae bacterium]